MEPTEKTNPCNKKKCNWKLLGYIAGGLAVAFLWIVLFATGLIVNSSYYRAAINYSFAEPLDWLMTVVSFTLSNVSLLALLAGILGGICSYVIVTQNCTLTVEELQKRMSEDIERKKAGLEPLYNINPVHFENPFLSGFRGVMVFVGILTLQYISSFADLSSIDKGSETAKNRPVATRAIGDTTAVAMEGAKDEDFMAYMSKIELDWMKNKESDSLVNYIFYYRNLINALPDTGKINRLKKLQYEANIKLIRNKLKIPSIAEIPGMTASSYFKFAVIVSFMAFLFGYDPSLFTGFLSKFSFTGGNQNK
jgi:hypothetical protein